MDHGPNPYVLDIEKATVENENYRTTMWTGEHLQMTVMSIPVGDDIGLEAHPDNDQFLRLEQGTGHCVMGPSEDEVTFEADVEDDWAIFVPAGVWHNDINTGDVPMRLYAIYSPSHHIPGTIHATKADDHGE